MRGFLNNFSDTNTHYTQLTPRVVMTSFQECLTVLYFYVDIHVYSYCDKISWQLWCKIFCIMATLCESYLPSLPQRMHTPRRWWLKVACSWWVSALQRTVSGGLGLESQLPPPDCLCGYTCYSLSIPCQPKCICLASSTNLHQKRQHTSEEDTSFCALQGKLSWCTRGV